MSTISQGVTNDDNKVCKATWNNNRSLSSVKPSRIFQYYGVLSQHSQQINMLYRNAFYDGPLKGTALFLGRMDALSGCRLGFFTSQSGQTFIYFLFRKHHNIRFEFYRFKTPFLPFLQAIICLTPPPTHSLTATAPPRIFPLAFFESISPKPVRVTTRDYLPKTSMDGAVGVIVLPPRRGTQRGVACAQLRERERDQLQLKVEKAGNILKS